MTPAPRARAVVSKADAPAGDLLDRIRGEYLEMPGLRLTPAQAARLWAVEPEVARALLSALVEAGFLTASSNGQHARRGDSECGDARHTTGV